MCTEYIILDAEYNVDTVVQKIKPLLGNIQHHSSTAHHVDVSSSPGLSCGKLSELGFLSSNFVLTKGVGVEQQEALKIL